MKIHIKSYRMYTLVATVLSAIFIFPSWFELSVPMLDSFLENESLYISFFSLPDFLSEHGLLTHITNIGGKTSALIVLLLSGILKYLCVLSAGLGLYGVWKSCIKKRPTRFILSSQIIALVLHFICLVIIISFKVILYIYSSNISDLSGLSPELFDVSFIPTIWFYLSLVCSVGSLIFSIKYKKES